MSTQTAFRCYYDDGTIIVSDFCPSVNDQGSPLIKSELEIIEDVTGTNTLPWLFLILGIILLLSKKGR